MRADLPAFLRRMASEPFVWGYFDCSLVIADWWLANHGIDPAAHLRGAYDSRESCHARLDREGGLLRLVARLARSVDAARIDDPAPGAFAIVRAQGTHLAAICTPGLRWAIKSDHSVLVTSSVHPVAMWSV
ncbi:DUF6950 family protein [Ancylobacter pratisalsi]|uniref:DUF6950 domain-containing protein n=1 Tax=Ancylobacter pratisalsi TaxID=1745854 RepID=A0A6P1YGH7_9HYPH|nr:hypothetical protein [Ancylobacter pratisalsi]QIB32252.1 hypothetical protein G3A50_02120 [Ancylobacter pratisalsi]